MPDCKAFRQHNCAYENSKTRNVTLEVGVAGKDQVVGIARVTRADRARQSGQAAVESIRTKVRQGRRRGRTLRQMRLAEGLAKLAAASLGSFIGKMSSPIEFVQSPVSSRATLSGKPSA